MIFAYINYPVTHITMHSSGCGHVRQQHKIDQRTVKLSVRTVSDELKRFQSKGHAFGATSEINDMWLEIDFNDSDFEKALVAYVHKLLSEHYSPFRTVIPEMHDCLR